MPPTNHAIVLSGAKQPLALQETSYTPPGPHELVVKTYAVAINAVDAYKQLLGDNFLPYINLPCVPGNDLAGEVIEVGSAVTRFHPGDRVCGEAAGTADFGNRQAESAFQEYVVLREHLTARIPDGVAYERAAVLPLGFSTAAYGLFHESTLGLEVPSVKKERKNKGLLITSGASSVGANAIQLAVAAGYDVYTTASPKNFELVWRLGAKEVFDYHDEGVAEKLIVSLEAQKLVGALGINAGGVALAGKVLNSTESVRFIADAGPPPPEGYPEGIECKFFIPYDLGDPESVVARIWRDFLPQALAEGSFVPEPEPLIVGKSLKAIQGAYNRVLKPVSAQKIVVTL
ncbi:GroES-like protein [Lophiostoma macrostomum CBS 122681]|uniref:GroES-like protein n=1 Tax=Lophiostoma macrostomum CBS 122681 TaxID=1314788 RepID=A0A6A6TJ61_9PLEO|nr:GroES-like protein [Lophiostoma macrostomum CBS 122681]